MVSFFPFFFLLPSSFSLFAFSLFSFLSSQLAFGLVELRDFEYEVYEVLGQVRDDQVPSGLEAERGLERGRERSGKRGRSRGWSQGEKRGTTSSETKLRRRVFFFLLDIVFALCIRPQGAPCGSILLLSDKKRRVEGTNRELGASFGARGEGRARPERGTVRGQLACDAFVVSNRKEIEKGRRVALLHSSPRRHNQSLPGLRGRAGRPSPAFGRREQRRGRTEKKRNLRFLLFQKSE